MANGMALLKLDFDLPHQHPHPCPPARTPRAHTHTQCSGMVHWAIRWFIMHAAEKCAAASCQANIDEHVCTHICKATTGL